MAKKSSLKCNEVKRKVPKRNLYEIAYQMGDVNKIVQIFATFISKEDDNLIIFDDLGNGKEVEVGAVKNWCYYGLVQKDNPPEAQGEF